MKYVALLRVTVFFAIAGSTLFAGRDAPAIDRAPTEVKQAANESAKAVYKLQETQPAPLPVVSVAPQQADRPMAAPSNQDHVVSISEIVSALDVSFSHQKSGAEWSQHAEQQVKGLFLPLTNKDTSLISVQCRTTLCRAEFRHATEAEFYRFLNTLKTGGLAPGWTGQKAGGRLGTNEHGNVTSVFFLAKEGTTLPMRPPADIGAGDGKNSSKPLTAQP